MKNLIIIGHPDKKSFCQNGILRTIKKNLSRYENELIEVIDLYEDNFNYDNTELIEKYKDLITWSERIYIISPVWWFRCTPKIEMFFDTIFTPGFAYKFKSITKRYGFPIPLLKDKYVRTYLTHGAPSLPVLTLYLNSVKLRLVMGVYSFVFGWFKTKTHQFWSVPFVSNKKRRKYLSKVRKHVVDDIMFQKILLQHQNDF
jgi:putative NADPH-quinone reductase